MPRRLLPVRFLHRPFSTARPSISPPPSPIPCLPALATPAFALPISQRPPPLRSPPPVSARPLPPYDRPSCLPDQPIPGPLLLRLPPPCFRGNGVRAPISMQ